MKRKNELELLTKLEIWRARDTKLVGRIGGWSAQRNRIERKIDEARKIRRDLGIKIARMEAILEEQERDRFLRRKKR